MRLSPLGTSAIVWPIVRAPMMMMMMLMMMSVKQSVEWELAGETEALGENLPQRYYVHHKSHKTWPALELRPPRWGAGD
jgi:hypothetical protein